jgi:hypothetical protein
MRTLAIARNMNYNKTKMHISYVYTCQLIVWILTLYCRCIGVATKSRCSHVGGKKNHLMPYTINSIPALLCLTRYELLRLTRYANSKAGNSVCRCSVIFWATRLSTGTSIVVIQSKSSHQNPSHQSHH